MLRTLDLRGKSTLDGVTLPRPDLADPVPIAQVREILAEVARHGDVAVREFSSRFDGVELDALRVPEEATREALRRIDPTLRTALEHAAESIESFHRHRAGPLDRYETDGITIEHLNLPVARVGVYAPGGRAKYPSSVLMTAIPAMVAGVGSIACCVPPGPDGTVADEVLVAAHLASVDEVYRIGGAQAIGALAYGTESVEKVDVIAGPGSRWVSLAQREVRGVVGVPSAFAGPSEVVVVADDSTPARFAAIDLIVQAEHGPDGLTWLITWSEEICAAVVAEVEALLEASPRRNETEATLAGGGYAVLVDGPEMAFAVSNAIAPEHLEILTDNAESHLGRIKNAGAIFLGPLSSASIGDYIAGPSHVLPTSATARFASVLGVEDFVRRVHAIRVDEAGIVRVARDVAAIANAEGLVAHAESALMRIGETGWEKT